MANTVGSIQNPNLGIPLNNQINNVDNKWRQLKITTKDGKTDIYLPIKLWYGTTKDYRPDTVIATWNLQVVRAPNNLNSTQAAGTKLGTNVPNEKLNIALVDIVKAEPVVPFPNAPHYEVPPVSGSDGGNK